MKKFLFVTAIFLLTNASFAQTLEQNPDVQKTYYPTGELRSEGDRSYYKSGKVELESVTDENQERVTKKYNEDGSLEFIRRGETVFAKNGKPYNGVDKFSSPGETLNHIEITYKDGKQIARKLYLRRILRSEQELKDGKEEGFRTEYDSQGVFLNKTQYHDGEVVKDAEGYTQIYDQTGVLIGKKKMVDGQWEQKTLEK